MSLSRRSLMQTAVLGSVAALAGAAGSAQAKIKKPLPAQKVSEKRRVLIQSSSHYHTSGYLDFAGEQYEQLYGSTKYEILFIPYAKVAGTYDGYEKQVQDAFKPFGHKTCPTLRTTNDMPIAEPPSFNTFGFIPFQTNPHFISAAGTSGLNNETREDRLEEFLWYNKDEEVIGLPEGTALFVTGEHDCEVIGPKDAEALYWFRQAEMGMRLERIALGTKFDLRKIVPGGKL